MSIRKGDYAIAGASVGFIGKPVWSRAVAVTDADLVAGYTVPADGMIVGALIPAHGAGTMRLFVNDVTAVVAEDNTVWASYGNCQVQVNKGDVVKIQPSASGSEGDFNFVPFEYSGVSGINVITPEYIRNQNILSDYEAVTLSTSVAATTIMQYDGFLSIAGERNDCAVYVNSVLAGYSIYKDHVDPTFAFTVPVKKGDSVYASGNASEVKARFYKLRDYSGR